MAASDGFYETTIFHLDLCVLAYQIYNQSIIWPVDPWYEQWSSLGSNRRDNVLREVHRSAPGQTTWRGPGATRSGWPTNTDLDPVLTDYRRLQPWVPCIKYYGGDFSILRSPEQLISRIADVTVAEYVDFPGDNPTVHQAELTHRIPNPSAMPGARDRLYAFEGGTGSVDDKPHAWALIGVILERDRGDGEYELHIAFRGSQSGSAFRAMFEATLPAQGNPDWVTDMEIIKNVADPRFAPTGSLVRGVRDASVTTFGSIVRCFEEIQATRQRPPAQIHVTGHSLGAVLATHAAAAATLGTFAEALPEAIRDWPWATLKLLTYSSPKPGDEDFAGYFDDHIDATRIWVESDPITEFPHNAHVGTPFALESDEFGPMCHEPSLVRQCLVAAHAWSGADVTTVPTDPTDLPWRNFPTLAEALVAAEDIGFSPADVVGADFDEHTGSLAEVAGRVMSTGSSYRFRWLRSDPLRRRTQTVAKVFGSSTQTPEELSALLEALDGARTGDGVTEVLKRMLILREAARNRWSTTELLHHDAIARGLGTGPWIGVGDAEPGAGPAADDGAATGAGAAGTTSAAADTGTETLTPTDVAITAPFIAARRAMGPAPSERDQKKIHRIVQMRSRHFRTVNQGSVKNFRRRVMPTSGMPPVGPACGHYPEVRWLPRQLVVPNELPPEARLPKGYVLEYYGTSLIGWDLYHRSPINPDVLWDPTFPWNHAFPAMTDGWEHPTDDTTFVRLRLQGPNPWLLRRTADPSGVVYEVDFTELFADILPPIVARFDLVDGSLRPESITVGLHRHAPGDPTWERAKQIVNAADVRFVAFGRHLLDVHLLLGQAYALATYSLPTWHPLRPFMAFFTYGTMQVNDMAYRALLSPKSYFIASGFMTPDAARSLFENGTRRFDFDQWNVEIDIERRGIDAIADHPYVDDAQLIWPEFVAVVNRHLDDLGLDDRAIADDLDLQTWYLTLTKLLPNVDPRAEPLHRARLTDLCARLLWNNVMHEIAGDLSPILESDDPADKAIINLHKLRAAWHDGTLHEPVDPPTMADVFLLDQASYTSRFNVGGNNLLAINAAKWVDDPKLRDAIWDLQATLTTLEAELEARNDGRTVRFARMLPSNWEASVSF